MDDTATLQDPRNLICHAMAEMRPSTADEIAEASGLESVTTRAFLDEMAGYQRIMFNPLTKRFSLPKVRPDAGIAA